MLKKQTLFGRDPVAYLFLLPWLIGFCTITLIPILSSLYLSFTSYDLMSDVQWKGLDNFAKMLTDDHRFVQSLGVTLKYVFIGVPLEIAFALLLAMALNKGIAGMSVYRTVYYVPSLFGGSVAIAILWRQVFGNEGVFNRLLGLFGIEGTSWIGEPSTALYTLIVLKVWQFGSPMIIFLAGLRQIPGEMYEAASIDGAGAFSRFFRITVPMLTPIIFFNVVMQFISSFQAFTPAFIISNGSGGPIDSTLFYTLYLYEQGFVNFKMGYASAMAWFLLFMIASMTALLFLSAKKWVNYDR